METGLIIAFNALFFCLFAWFLNRQFNGIDKQFESIDKRFESIDKRFESLDKQIDRRFESLDKQLSELKADNREIRNQVYNHIPSQIKELEKSGHERDKKIEMILRKLDNTDSKK